MMPTVDLMNSVPANSVAESASQLSLDTSRCGPTLPVKNTFIHFGGLRQQNNGRSLRRWRTDPEDPMPLSLACMKSESASTASLALSNDSCSTTEPPSEIDALEVAPLGALACFDLADATLRTPEQSPRHSRWESPEEITPAPAAQAAARENLQPLHDVALRPLSPMSMRPQSSASSLSSSPASSGFLDGAINSLSGTPSTSFLAGGVCFDFTLRLADNIGLGLDLEPCTYGREALFVQGVLQNGAIAAWNKQCFDGFAKRPKSVWPGDAIVSVNGKTDNSSMIHECKTQMLLKLTLFRPVWDAGPCFGAVPTNCYWPAAQLHHMMLQNRSREGERLHSCKKLVDLLSLP